MNKLVSQAVKILNSGGIIIFPTDTAFGIGCRMDNPQAVRKLFQIRERPLSQPTPVLVSSSEMAKKYANISKDVELHLLEKYWPGALTVIVPVKNNVVELLQKDGGIGLRMPNHEMLLEIISQTEVGILGPSANFHGKQTPYLFQDLDPELIKKVDFVVEGECNKKKVSTVISCLNTPWIILRQGAVIL